MKRKNTNDTTWAFIIILLIGMLSIELLSLSVLRQPPNQFLAYAGISIILADTLLAPSLLSKASKSKISIGRYAIVELFGLPASLLLSSGVASMVLSAWSVSVELLTLSAILASAGIILISRKKPRTKAYCLSIVAVLIVVFILYYVYGYNSYGKISYAITPSSSFNNQTANALKLNVSVSNAIISYTSNISIKMKLTNTGNWPYKLYHGNYSTNQPPCGLPYQFGVFGVNIYQGNYAINDISGKQPLLLWQPGAIYSCPSAASEANKVPYYIGAHNSVSLPITLKGFWTMTIPGNFSTDNFSYFLPGIYTVVAEDEWGQEAISHFTVMDNNS